MPRYVYKCNKCDESFVVVHGMTEDMDHCEVCFELNHVHRIPQMPSVKIVKEEAGKIVREYIEDAKKDLSNEKRKLKEKDYNIK